MAVNTKMPLTNTADGYLCEGTDIRGGYFVIDKLVNIPSTITKVGSLCFCQEDSKFYQFNGTSWESSLVIPSIDGLASEEFVTESIKNKIDDTTLENYYTKTEADEEFMTQSEVDTRINDVISTASNTDTIKDLTSLVDYLDNHGTEASEMAAAITSLEENKADKTELFSKSYKDLTDLPEIPEAYNDTEVKNLIAEKADKVHYHEEYLTEHQSLEDYYTKLEVDNKIPLLDGYAKTEDIPTDYLKESDLEGYSKFSGSYNDLTDKPEIPDLTGYATESYVDAEIKAELEKLSIPSIDGLATESYVDDAIKNIDIPDISNFITEVPSEYITETELKNELNTYATTEYVDEKIENIDAIVGDLDITYTNDMETINAVGGIPAGFKFEGE
jgi:hypothetical protein